LGQFWTDSTLESPGSSRLRACPPDGIEEAIERIKKGKILFDDIKRGIKIQNTLDRLAEINRIGIIDSNFHAD
jgi:hypothetical protein